MSYYYSHPAQALSSPADSMHTEERIMALFYPGSAAPAVAVQDTSALALENDLKALILQARRINLLNKCLAECDALLASPQSSTPQSLRSYLSYSSPSDSDPSFGMDNSGEYDWGATVATLVFTQDFYNTITGKPCAIAQHQPPSPGPCSESLDGSDSEESFFDTQWITPDGLVPADLLDQARLDARAIDDLVPRRPYALSAAGWSQLGDLYLEAAATAKAAAQSDVAFARAAQMRMKAAQMYRIAHQVRDCQCEVAADSDSGSGSEADAASLPLSVSDHYVDVDVDTEPERTSKLYAPVPVRARRPNEPRAVEWLQNVAELHLAYWQQCQTSNNRRTGSAGGPLRARSVREELDNMEYWYRVQYMQDPNWCPVF